MSEFHEQFERYMRLATVHPDKQVVRTFSRTIIFDLTDSPSFVMDVRDGEISTQGGTRDLDWRGRDWQSVSCVRTTQQILEKIMAGEILPTEAFVMGLLGWGSRGMASINTSNRSIYRWLCQIFRLASEQADLQGRRDLVDQIRA